MQLLVFFINQERLGSVLAPAEKPLVFKFYVSIDYLAVFSQGVLAIKSIEVGIKEGKISRFFSI